MLIVKNLKFYSFVAVFQRLFYEKIMKHTLLSTLAFLHALFATHLNAQIHSVMPSKVSSSTSQTLFEQAKIEPPQKAAGLLRKALNDPLFRRLSLDTRVEIFLQLARALRSSREFHEEEKLLMQLLEDSVYERFWIQIKIALANSFLDQKRFFDAERLMQELQRVPKRKLTHLDSECIASICCRMDTAYVVLLHDAENAYKAKKYPEAIEAYVVLLKAQEIHRFPNTWSKQNVHEVIIPLNYRLACSYYLAGDFEKCFKTLQKYERPSFTFSAVYWKNKALYALCASKLGLYEVALGAWNEYVQKFPDQVPAYIEAIQVAVKSGDFLFASTCIEQVKTKELSQKMEQKLVLVSYLKALEEGDFETAKSFAEKDILQKDILQDDPLYAEFLFLQGYHRAKMHEAEKAVVFLEKSIAHITRDVQVDTRLLLATCYVEIAKTTECEPQVLLERAQTCIDECSQIEPNKAYIAKTRIAACHYNLQNSDANQVKLLDCVNEAPHSIFYEVSLIAYSAFQDQKMLKMLTDSRFSKEKAYGQALFLYAKKTRDVKAMHTAFLHVLKSGSFHKSHLFLLECTKWLIDHDAAKAQVRLHEYEKKLRENKAYKHLLQECVYFQHYARAYKQKNPEILIKACTSFASEFGQNIHHDKLLHLLSLCYFQNKDYIKAKEVFSEHLTLYPESEKRDEVLMYLARSCKQLGENPKSIYVTLYTNHPHSCYAEEAYFRTWPEKAYALLQTEAILHLKKSPYRNQKGVFSALTNFYIAQNIVQEAPENNLTEIQCSHLQEAIYLFEQTRSALDGETIQGLLTMRLVEIACTASFESAKALLQITNSSTKSKEAFDVCQNKFQDLQQTINQQLKTEKSALLQTLTQESSWQRYRIYKLQGEEKCAREELQHLIEYATKNNCFKTESTLKAMCEYALILTREKNSVQANALLEKAEAIAGCRQNKALMLHVWYAKSLCARYNKNIDQSMRYLSMIINDDAVSSLRVQAMFLRSELYELKGRRDLALRQLEACAKKGGEWAERAKQKIEEQYGYE